MNLDEMAIAMVDCAISVGQVALRADASTPTGDLRAALRRMAHDRGERDRTGMLGDVLILARADADLWQQPESSCEQGSPYPTSRTFSTNCHLIDPASPTPNKESGQTSGAHPDRWRRPRLPVADQSGSPQSTNWSMATSDQCAPQALSTGGQARPA